MTLTRTAAFVAAILLAAPASAAGQPLRDVILNAIAADCVKPGYEGETPEPTRLFYSWPGRVWAVARELGATERQAWRAAAECKKTTVLE